MSLPVDLAGDASRTGTAVGLRRLWILLLVVLPLALSIGVWVVLRPMWRDLQVIAEIERAGGEVTRHDTDEERDRRISREPKETYWEWCFARMTGGARWKVGHTCVTLGWSVPAEQLSMIAHVRGLGQIYLQGPQWTDAHLEWIARSVRVSTLILRDTSITGRGFTALRSSPIDSLHLSWRDSKPTLRGGLSFIRGFDKLNHLSVEDIPLADDDLLILREHPLLNRLELSRVSPSAAGVAILKTIPNLESLALTDSDVGDAVLAVLAEMPKLSTVDLAGGMITDSGLAALPATLRWTYLHLDRNPITAAGIAAMNRYPATFSIRDTCVEISADHYRLLGPRGCERLVIRKYMVDDEVLAGPLSFLQVLDVDWLQ